MKTQFCKPSQENIGEQNQTMHRIYGYSHRESADKRMQGLQ